MTAFSITRRDIQPPRSVEDTALAIANRIQNDATTPFAPTVVGPFDHGTTATSSAISSVLTVTTLTSASTIADLVAASTKIIDYCNNLNKVVNRVVYVLEANGMTS